MIHKSINFSRKPESPEALVELHLEKLTITAIITNVYIPPASSCAGGYIHSLAHLMLTTYTRGTLLENMKSGSNVGILNWDSPTRLPASLITSTNWQTKTNLGSYHLQILISLQMDLTINPIPHRNSFNLKKQPETAIVRR